MSNFDRNTQTAMALCAALEGWKGALDDAQKLRSTLERLHDWASSSNDWRPDSPLGREVHAAISAGKGTE